VSVSHSEKSVVKPFFFQGLKKLNKKQIQLEEALLNYFPQGLSKNPLQKKLEDFFMNQFHVDCHLELRKIEELSIGQWLKSLPSQCVVAHFGMHPINQTAYLWVDSVIAYSLIDRLLGGEGEYPTELKPLTPIEEGVLQYLLLKTLTQLSQSCGNAESMHFRLEKITRNSKEIVLPDMQNTPSVLLHFRLQIGSCTGFVLLVLPNPLLESAFLGKEPLEQIQDSSEDLLAPFQKMSYVRADLWAEIGSVSLTISEKNQLEKGDVILFDQTHSHMADGHLAGNVVLRVGDGKSGGFLTQLVSADSPTILRILDYYGGEG